MDDAVRAIERPHRKQLSAAGVRRWLGRLAWVLVVAGVLAAVYYRSTIRMIPVASAVPASHLALVDLEGTPVSLARYRGKPILLNLWASWCGPCRREIPRLVRIDQRLRDRGLVVLGLSLDQLPPEKITAVAGEFGVSYRVVVPDGPLHGTFGGADVIPHTWLLDREGRLRASHAGLATEGSLRRACERLLEEPWSSNEGP